MKIGSFISRHLGPRMEDQTAMLRVLGAPSLDDLIEQTVPGAIRLRERLSVSTAMTESEYLEHIDELASEHSVPQLHWHGLLPYGSSKCYSSQYPRKPRLVHGLHALPSGNCPRPSLEALLNFQTTVMDLTGMEVANASLLDEGTAAAEAMAMLFAARPRPQVKEGRNRFLVDARCVPSNPQRPSHPARLTSTSTWW